MDDKKNKKALGIDIGTSNCSIAIFLNGKASISHDDKGCGRMPSCVAFNETECLIGDAASRQSYRNHGNTIFGAKGFLSKDVADLIHPVNKNLWPFEMTSDPGKVMFKIDYQDYERHVYPKEIMTILMTKLIENAKACLKEEITDAVITVPVHFNHVQRSLIKKAGVKAGLNVLRLLHETSAAAIGYCLDKNVVDVGNMLVFDLGGSATQTSVICFDESGVFEVLSIESTSLVGGQDFTNSMVSFFIAEIKRKYDKDISRNKKTLNRLRIACNKAKHDLSSCTRAYVELYSIFDEDFSSSISREYFEELNRHLFKKAIKTVEKALTSANCCNADIKKIVMVGGSSKIPKIKEMLTKQFGSIEICIAPDTAVASGAAYQAAILAGYRDEVIKNTLLLDVAPFSVGIETKEGAMIKILAKNTTIPTKQIQCFTTRIDNQRFVEIRLYEGERLAVERNRFLGVFYLCGLQPEKQGKPEIEVAIDVDSNGRMVVTAEEMNSGNGEKIIIDYNEGEEFVKESLGQIHLKRDAKWAFPEIIQTCHVNKALSP